MALFTKFPEGFLSRLTRRRASNNHAGESDARYKSVTQLIEDSYAPAARVRWDEATTIKASIESLQSQHQARYARSVAHHPDNDPHNEQGVYIYVFKYDPERAARFRRSFHAARERLCANEGMCAEALGTALDDAAFNMAFEELSSEVSDESLRVAS